MLAAMTRAPVGDEQHGDDPTVHELCDRMAALLGKPAAMFLPSGTMCNQIAILTHCRPGDEIIAHETAHIVAAEGGAPAALTGASVLGLRGARGQFDVDTLRAAFREKRRNAPPQTLLEVEQTANLGGGAIWPLDALNAVLDCAHAQRHGDAHGRRAPDERRGGDRAAGATSSPPTAIRCGWISPRGLGRRSARFCAGPSRFIDQAWRWKQRLGGSLRQAGVCAAACLYALDHNIGRLAEDHANARALARGSGAICQASRWRRSRKPISCSSIRQTSGVTAFGPGQPAPSGRRGDLGHGAVSRARLHPPGRGRRRHPTGAAGDTARRHELTRDQVPRPSLHITWHCSGKRASSGGPTSCCPSSPTRPRNRRQRFRHQIRAQRTGLCVPPPELCSLSCSTVPFCEEFGLARAVPGVCHMMMLHGVVGARRHRTR